MTNFKSIGSQTVGGAIGVELLINPGDRIVYFPDIAVLRDKKIKYIDVCNQLTISPTGNPVFNSNQCDLTFVKHNTQIQIIKNLPVTELQTSVRNGNRLLFNHKFDFEASFVTIRENNYPTQRSLYFVFWYDEPAVSGIINNNAETAILDFEIELTKSRNYFLENRTLVNKMFRNILLSFPHITAEHKEGISESTGFKSFITLQKNNLQFFQSVPLYLFYQADKYYMLNLQNIRFDFTNSYIDVVNPVEADLKSVFFNCIIEN